MIHTMSTNESVLRNAINIFQSSSESVSPFHLFKTFPNFQFSFSLLYQAYENEPENARDYLNDSVNSTFTSIEHKKQQLEMNLDRFLINQSG